MGDAQAEVDELFTLPLEEFIAARDALAGRMAAGGDKTEAGTIRKIRKPNLAAWALNRLAHRHREDVRNLVELWDELAAAPDAATVGEIGRRRKKLVARLLGLVEKDLASSGHLSSATMDKVARTLNSGAVGADRDRLLAGRLERELDPAGFAAWTGSGLPDPEQSALQRDLEGAVSAVDDAREEMVRAVHAAERAEQAAERAAATADQARAASAKARERHEQAIARLRELEGP